MSRAAVVRVLVPALLALALLAHHGGPPPPAAGHHGADGCPACGHAPDGGGLAAACLGVLGAALALPGLAAALGRRRPAPAGGAAPFARGPRAPLPPERAPPRPRGIADLCVLRR